MDKLIAAGISPSQEENSKSDDQSTTAATDSDDTDGTLGIQTVDPGDGNKPFQSDALDLENSKKDHDSEATDSGDGNEGQDQQVSEPVNKNESHDPKTIETENISANGVLFRMDADVPVGSAVDFTLSLPADVVGAEADVQVDCRGRVVRSFDDGGRRGVGVVIDEYRFGRR